MEDPRMPRRPPPPFPTQRQDTPTPRVFAGENDTTRPYGATPSIGAPTPRPETPNRTGPGGTPATMPTQRPGNDPQPQPEQPRDKQTRPVPQQGKDPNQGEGDRISSRAYAEHVQDFVASGQVEPAARDAARAVDGPEAAELRAAEAAGKRPAEVSVLERARGIVQRVADVVGDKVAELKARRGKH